VKSSFVHLANFAKAFSSSTRQVPHLCVAVRRGLRRRDRFTGVTLQRCSGLTTSPRVARPTCELLPHRRRRARVGARCRFYSRSDATQK
jgi:hypothetical protein